MKGKFRRRAGPAPPILALAALVVALLVAATTPIALAKYVANATGSASGTVAKWSVTKGVEPSTDLVVFRNEAVYLPASGNTKTISISIDSQVATDIVIKPNYGSGFDGYHKESQSSPDYNPIWDIVPSLAPDLRPAASVYGTQFAYRYGPGPKTITFTIHLYGLGKPYKDAGGYFDPRIVPSTGNYDRTYTIEFDAVQVD